VLSGKAAASSGSGPGGGIVEVEPAGGVDGVLAGAHGQAGEEDRFVVIVVAGAVDRKLPLAGGADIPQPTQFQGGGVGQGRIDIAEDPRWRICKLAIWGLRSGAQPLFQGRLGGVRVLGHGSHPPEGLGGHSLPCRALARVRQADAPRSGRPSVFTGADRAEAIALACALPTESGVPLPRWSGPDLARELDSHRGQVTGRFEDTTGIAPFGGLVEQVMTTEPYVSTHRVFWIVDNGSSHRGAASAQRIASTGPHAQLIHLAAHASWLDQAEICFFVVQRKVPTPNDTDLDQRRDRLAAFDARYNAIAQPFTWRFHPRRRQNLLRRIDAHHQRHVLAA
jgi:hypothetical protein